MLTLPWGNPGEGMGDLNFETYDRLVGAIYRAGLDPSEWAAAIDEIDAHVDGAYLGFYGFDPSADASLGMLHTRYDPSTIEDFLQHYAGMNPFIDGLMTAPVLEMSPGSRWVSNDALRRTEFYAGFFAPNDGIGPGVGGVIARDAGRLVVMSGHVRFKDEEAIAPRLLETLRRLAPHLRRALDAQRRLTGTRLLAGDAGPGSRAAVVLDVFARVLDATPTARAMMAEQDRISRSADGRLRFPGARTQRWLEVTLRRFALGQIGRGPDVHALGEGGQGAAFLEPVPETHDGVTRLALALDPRRAVAILVLAPAPTDRERGIAILRRLHGLTDAEAGVALALGVGAAPDEIAAAKGVSVHTVRSQIRAIFLRTGCTRQGQVAALVRDLLG